MPRLEVLAVVVALGIALPATAQEHPIAKRCFRLAVEDAKKVESFARAEQAKARGDLALKASLQICRGYAFEQLGRINEASSRYQSAVEMSEKSGNKAVLSDALALRGEMHHYRGEFEPAIEDLKRAYDVAQTPGQQRYILNAMANLYADRRVGAYDRAIEYYRQLLVLHERAGNESGIATAHFNIGATLDTKGDLPGALASYQRALTLEQKRGDATQIAEVQRGLGVTLTKLKRYDEALAVLEPSLAHFQKMADEESIAAARLARGSVLRHLGRTNEAIRDLNAARAHFIKAESNRFLEKTEEERANAFAAIGNWPAAYEARGALMAVRQKMSERLREEHVSRLRVQFETEKKEQENRSLQLVRRYQGVAIVLGGIVIAFLVYFARRMRMLALTDELTKLPNRRNVLTYAEEQLRATRADGRAFSMLALDIDFFKKINDTCGHLAGDIVLRRVANTCRTHMRRGEMIGRTGGEEFLVVLPGADAKAAAVLGERLRASVEAIDCTDIAPDLRITISVGVSQWTAPDDFSAVAKRADELLYRAKERGRNRVELAYA